MVNNVISVLGENDLQSFENLMNNKGSGKKSDCVVLVWFYADWCGHCQAMKDEWQKLESKCSQKENNHLKIAKVKDTMIPLLKNKPQVQGYPTLKLYKNGNEVEDYQGSRSSDELLNYLNSNTKKPKTKKHKKISLKMLRNPNFRNRLRRSQIRRSKCGRSKCERSRTRGRKSMGRRSMVRERRGRSKGRSMGRRNRRMRKNRPSISNQRNMIKHLLSLSESK